MENMQAISKDCVCQELENGIWHIIFYRNTNEAVDEYIHFIDRAMQEFVNGQRQFGSYVPVLIEMKQTKTPPSSHLFPRYKRLISKYPNRIPHTRVAYLHRTNFLGSLGTAFAQLLPTYAKTQRRFFELDEYDAAVTWLLADYVASQAYYDEKSYTK